MNAPTVRTPDRPDPDPEYVAAIEQALAVVWEPRQPARAASLKPRTTLAPRTRLAVARRAIRTAVLALAALAGISLLGAAAIVDWWAPTVGPSACSEVALPLVVGVVGLAALGLAGSVVRELRARREGSAPYAGVRVRGPASVGSVHAEDLGAVAPPAGPPGRQVRERPRVAHGQLRDHTGHRPSPPDRPVPPTRPRR